MEFWLFNTVNNSEINSFCISDENITHNTSSVNHINVKLIHLN